MKNALLLTVLLALLVLMFQALYPATPTGSAGHAVSPPWQIEKLPDGHTRVFGLVPGVSTLAEAREHLGPDLNIAVIATPDETGTLEAFHDSFSTGFVTGKLILTMEADEASIAAMKQRSPKSDYMESSTRKYRLAAADMEAAQGLPIRAIGFIPSTHLDAATVEQRFGRPTERLKSGEDSEHLLYPDQGLDIAINAKGRELLQYVAPKAFAPLRELLIRNQ
ncbi:hypothetical protein [Denitratisoma oestradiolicum]|uniref:Uncharacterized protein n=1 Tax=Denitratisoma oestradiolicum TaxID=311182 RepID=A0A6S6XTY6_9PROT|nr:hypothetical protein [Denitratisoma oestradiolicum]TWO79255.1 hypothetical protein CBW56_15815 [Denitratisoma oestradiolicum]CAB1368260.1 conserved exported protein of unknown function [Denitratisoma oestradiolicum]